jgi:K+ potassium transporter integral membrane domain
VSLIVWSVMIVVTVTYVLLVMRADNDGEGGIMALITLIRRRSLPSGRRTAVVLAALGVFGAALFFGDSMITPGAPGRNISGARRGRAHAAVGVRRRRRVGGARTRIRSLFPAPRTASGTTARGDQPAKDYMRSIRC